METYSGTAVVLKAATSRPRRPSELVAMQYQRNDDDFHRGAFRVRGDTVDIFPALMKTAPGGSNCSAMWSKRSPSSIP